MPRKSAMAEGTASRGVQCISSNDMGRSEVRTENRYKHPVSLRDGSSSSLLLLLLLLLLLSSRRTAEVSLLLLYLLLLLLLWRLLVATTRDCCCTAARCGKMQAVINTGTSLWENSKTSSNKPVRGSAKSIRGQEMEAPEEEPVGVGAMLEMRNLR